MGRPVHRDGGRAVEWLGGRDRDFGAGFGDAGFEAGDAPVLEARVRAGGDRGSGLDVVVAEGA